jgi:hypothetical protein
MIFTLFMGMALITPPVGINEPMLPLLALSMADYPARGDQCLHDQPHRVGRAHADHSQRDCKGI